MARISGTSIPDGKQIHVALTYIHGIGPKASEQILSATKIDPTVRVKDLTDAEVGKIQEAVNADYTVEGELQRLVSTNIKRLKDIKSYRGSRHLGNLPSRGQRTRTNARTRRGKRLAVGGAQPKSSTKT